MKYTDAKRFMDDNINNNTAMHYESPSGFFYIAPRQCFKLKS